jgi:diaminopimelate epimerase
MDLRFFKIRVCDADLLLVDDSAGNGRDRDWGAAARFLLDRRRGAGGDRLAVLAKAEASTWLRVYRSDGEASPCLFDAALCAARFLLDSGRGESGGLRLRVPGGEVSVDVLDGASLGIALGEPRGVPDGAALDQAAAGARRSTVESGGQRFEVLPLGLAMPGGRRVDAVTVFYEGGTKTARARIRASTRDLRAPEVLPLRLVSREEVWADAPRGPGLDATTIAGLSLAAAAAAGFAETEALVRLRGGALWIEWAEEGGLYAAARPEYVYSGEFHLDEAEGASGEEGSDGD